MNEECGLESFKKVANKLVSSSRLGASDFMNEECGLGEFESKVVMAQATDYKVISFENFHHQGVNLLLTQLSTPSHTYPV